jgi:hypothetical protein
LERGHVVSDEEEEKELAGKYEKSVYYDKVS